MINKYNSVCLCGIDVSSQFRDFRRSFESMGLKVYSFLKYAPTSSIDTKDSYTYVNTDIVPFYKVIETLPISRKWKVLLKSLSRKTPELIGYDFTKSKYEDLMTKCDVFVFMYNTVYPDRRDFKFLKAHGKKVVMIFCGDDARWYNSQKQEFESLGLDYIIYPDDYDHSLKSLNYRLELIRNAEKYADIIYSKREQSQLQIRPFRHFPMTIYGSDYEYKSNAQRVVPRVVHAPSSPIIKGTKHVLEAVENLKNEGVKFDFILLENVPNHKAKEIYGDCDIIIDQLLATGGGRLSTEGLACGKVVMSRMNYKVYDQGFPTDSCPIIDVGPKNLQSELKKIILDPELRNDLSSEGPIYVNKYLLAEKFCFDILESLQKIEAGEEMVYHHEPSFYKSNYVPSNSNERKLLKSWDDFLCE